LDKVIGVYGDKLELPKAEISVYVTEFFAGRLRYIFEKQGHRYDLVNAALGAGIDNFHHVAQRVKALDGLKLSPQFEPFILMAKRIKNITGDLPAASINPASFVDKAEKELYAAFSIVRDNAAPMLAKGDFVQAQKMIFRLQPLLNDFFDKVMVMAEEPKLRRNRIALLQGIRRILDPTADYSQVVVEGEKGKTKK
jgi:glycyl-tRNA synthetase beta chain